MAASRTLYQNLAFTIRKNLEEIEHIYQLAPETLGKIAQQHIWELVHDIAADLKEDNLNFKIDKFLEACGVQEENGRVI